MKENVQIIASTSIRLRNKVDSNSGYEVSECKIGGDGNSSTKQLINTGLRKRNYHEIFRLNITKIISCSSDCFNHSDNFWSESPELKTEPDRCDE